MKKGLTELVFILDRSGSMGGLESDTIGGFNSVINKQNKENGEILVSTVLFSDNNFVLHDRENIKNIKPLTDEDYQVGGGTALLDAVGEAIHHIATIHKYAREEDRPEHVMFFITTDGMENSSSQYSFDKIKTMIDLQKEKFGWEFVFMGANIDAFDVASKMGISCNRTVNTINDDTGIKRSYDLMNILVGCCRNMSREKADSMMSVMCCEENRVTNDRKAGKKRK